MSNILVTKKYVFERILADEPIVLDLMEVENRKKFIATREKFYEWGVYTVVAPDNHGRDNIVTHTIEVIVPRNGMPHTTVIKKGHRWANVSPPGQYLP